MSRNNQAFVDPEALSGLANDFTVLASKISQMGSGLDRGLAALGETFRDEHYFAFKADFQATRVKLDGFAQEVLQLTPKLRADAEDIRASQRVELPE